MEETLVRNRFITEFKRLIPGLTVLEQQPEVRMRLGNVDLILRVRIGDVEKTFVCEVKSSGEPRYVYQGVSRVKLLSSAVQNSYPMLLVPHIGESGREICLSSGVGYVDLDGNCFIKFDNVFIQRETRSRDLSASFTVRKPQRRLFTGLYSPLSSRIVRMLLLDPGRSWSLTELSKALDVSLGYVHKVAKALENHGYALRDNNYRLKVNRPGSLLDDWAARYDFVQGNKLHSFYTFERDVETFITELGSVSEEKGLRYALTLHAGAFKVAPYVRFTDIHFYVDPKDISSWRDALDLRPVERGGAVFMVEPFDKGVFQGLQSVDSTKVVSNVQLYVDLYNYPARGKEQAEFLREHKITFR